MRPIRFRFDMATTESEYRANLAGLNTFFGAVLGFVVSDFQGLHTRDYVHLLVLCGALVISILYISNSHKRWTYTIFAAVLIFALPHLVRDAAVLPSKLQATFAVWLGMAMLFEFTPRKADPTPPPGA